MAGFVGSGAAWDTFEEVWARIGDDAIAPGFHAKVFFRTDTNRQRVGAYKGWSDDRATRLISGVVDAVNGSRVHPVVIAIELDGFNHLTPSEQQILTRGREKPYFMGFELAILESTSRIKPPGCLVDFIFDRNQVFENAARSLYADLEAEGDHFSRRMGNLDFRSSLETPALQAADLLAHCWYQLRPDARRLKLIRPVMESWTDKDYQGHIWAKDTFDKAFGRAPRTRGMDYEVRISESGRYSIAPARE